LTVIGVNLLGRMVNRSANLLLSDGLPAGTPKVAWAALTSALNSTVAGPVWPGLTCNTPAPRSMSVVVVPLPRAVASAVKLALVVRFALPPAVVIPVTLSPGVVTDPTVTDDTATV